MPSLRFLLPIFLLWLSAPLSAESFDITLDDAPLELKLGRHLGLYEDAERHYSSDSLPARDLFHPHPRDNISLGYSNSAWWAHFHLHNPGEQTHRLLLRQQYPLIDELDVVVVDERGNRQVFHTGDSLPFSQREIAQSSFLFPLEVAAGERLVVYTRFHSSGPVNIALTLYDPVTFTTRQESESLIKGAYYGGMLVLVFYNLFLFFGVRDRSYLYYVIYASSYAVFQAVYNGIAFQYWWPNSPWWGNHSFPLLLCISFLSMMHFARHFLTASERTPRLDRAGRGVEVTFVVIGLSSLVLPYALIIRPAVLMALLTVILILVMGSIALRSGYQPARYFLLAWITLIIGVVLAVLKSFGLLPHTALTEYGFQIGSFIEITLLSLALADRMEKLKRESVTDPLTGCYNRRYFDERLAAEFSRSWRHDEPLSLILIDIDHFKQFNDRFGHACGDRALCQVAEALGDMMRKHDTLCRIGGEEFAVILPSTGKAPALQVAERLRVAISELSLNGEPLSISLGVSGRRENGCRSAYDLQELADRALYGAKAAGRDQVVMSTVSMTGNGEQQPLTETE